MQTTTTDVLIIGAGPTGLTLAVDLARRGIDFRIVERELHASTASKAKTIQPRALEVLDDLGAVAEVVRIGAIALPVRYHHADGGTVDSPSMSVRASDAFSSPYSDPIWIAQFDVVRALQSRLADFGRSVEFATEADFVAQDADQATMRLTTDRGVEEVRARYVVAADGGRSGTRRAVGLPLVGRTYESQRWYLGDVTEPTLDRTSIHIWPTEQGMLGLTPLPGSDLWQLQGTIRPEDDPIEPSLDGYQTLFDERTGAGSVTFTSATWLSMTRVNVRMVGSYRSGRVLLAGDAAHVHSPAGGQGMATGIQDAYNLGWKLAAVIGGAPEELLDTYEEERMPVARSVLEDSTRKMHATLDSANTAGGEALSGALASLADDITTGLPIHYAHSSLSLPMTTARHVPVRPGDRAPDVTGLAGAFAGSLFDLLRGPHWSLLAGSVDAGEKMHEAIARRDIRVYTVGGDLIDETGEFSRIYGAEDGEVILVRPDGYVAARLSVGDADALIGYVREWAPAQPVGSRSSLD